MEGKSVDTQEYDCRGYLEDKVNNRAEHRTEEDVHTTCSLARADRLLGREYHGRFLIELLQNAADASRGGASVPGDSRVAVRISEEGPALLVANNGFPMSAEVVINSLGQIGASTKPVGEAIGHKGIGFKSVLELTHAPEIYSGPQNSRSALAVGFDPEKAYEKIRDASPNWNEWVAKVDGLDENDPFAAVPILRFPYWIEDLPKEIADLREEGFDTVVRLPFDERLGFDFDEWIGKVRAALRGVTDQILLLLGCFDEVRIENRLDESDNVVITREWEQTPVEIEDGASREIVRVRRNGRLSSRWRLFRRELPGRQDLSGEVAVGIRVGDEPEIATVLPAVDGHPSAPFHLFFPTSIRSGLPFLLHAYFEVDTARTGFYGGSANRNETMLAGLAELTKIAVEDAVESGSLDLASLVNLVAEAGEPPDDSLAGDFRSNVLGRLDKVAWIPLRNGHDGRRSECPEGVFSERRDLVQRIGNAFSEPYIERRIRLRLPDTKLEDPALELVKNRRPDALDPWEVIDRLCRPGEDPPWSDAKSADERFRHLITLFESLNVENSEETERLLAGLRGDPESRLIPTVGAGETRTLLPIPNLSESSRGRGGRGVMARVRSYSGRDLVPPGILHVAFLHEGLLSSESEVNRANPLGVRPFTVDTVLDRLNGIEEVGEEDGKELVRFLWQFLASERSSSFGTKESAERAATFDPSRWFWCAPGSVWQDAARARQQRERYLTTVPLPCQDGKWRQAGHIAFGADWADWLERRAGEHPSAATEKRASAYRAMEKVSPGDWALLASPETVWSLLDESVFDDIRQTTDDGESDEVIEERQRDAEKHAFLLRLGVWEVPPIEAFQNRTERGEDKFPRAWRIADRQREVIEGSVGWQFDLGGFRGDQHHNVHLAEDYRFLWPLEEMARRSESALVESLGFGETLYLERANALVFCPRCGSHSRWRKSTSADGYSSSLAIQLRSERWLPCTLDGKRLDSPSKPESAWWLSKPPSAGALRQSPWRFVPLCGSDEGVDENLRSLVGVNTLDEASPDAVEKLLRDLRERFYNDRLVSDPRASGSARQAFIGLHRIAYERLAKLESGQSEAAKDVAHRTRVLCDLGGTLIYCQPSEARHDDGRFAAHKHHFAGRIPFAVLSSDRTAVANALGIPRFELELTRVGEDKGQDITDEVREIHADRIPELLAIMAHHSLGAQTPDETSPEFKVRANRIRSLRIIKLDDLIVDAVAKGLDIQVKIGERSDQDLFLENPTSSSPILFHDFSGDWQDRLRRKIAPYFATILENPAYAHTFMAFLQNDEGGREEFLHDLGISENDVNAIESTVGIAGKEERQLRTQWFRAILETRGYESSGLSPDSENLISELKDSGLPDNIAHSLADLGGGEEARRETGEGSALRLLHEAEMDLKRLHEILHGVGDEGLAIRDSRDAFHQWLGDNRQRLSAVLATKSSPESAKALVRSLKPPPELEFSLDPELPDVLSLIVKALQDAELPPADAHKLAKNPAEELARIGGFGTISELEGKVEFLLDGEERGRILRQRASEWRREIQLLAILASVNENETPRNIRDMDEKVSGELPRDPSSPVELRDALGELFRGHPALAAKIRERLTETVHGTAPNREESLEWARQAGVAVDRLANVERALNKPKREHARELKKRSQLLGKVRPATPGFLRQFAPEPPVVQPPGEGERIKIGRNKVGPGYNDHIKKLGDEGEQWALAAVIGDLMDLPEEARGDAINKIEALIRRRFEGDAANEALGHAELARKPGLDDEDLIEALSDLLHVSRHSDLFGFDMVGWVAPTPDGEKQAVCLEVKSSAGEGFHLSLGEWNRAEQFHKERAGSQYAVLVVRRAKGGGAPERMDLLPDPVKLEKTGLLRKKPDGYQIAYGTEDA